MHVHRKMLAAPALAAAALIMGTVAVFAHDVQTVTGTVGCNGAYTIVVGADVWQPVTFDVNVGGSPIDTSSVMPPIPATNPGPNTPFTITGSGGTVGESIAARTSDESWANGATGTLTASGGDCTRPSLGYSTTCAVPGTAQGGALIITFGGNSWPDASGTHPNSIRVDGGSAQAVTSTTSTTGPYSVGDHVFTTQPQGVEPVNENGWPFKISACAVPTPTPTPRPTPTPSGPPVPITGANAGAGLPIGVPLIGIGAALTATGIWFTARLRREDI